MRQPIEKREEVNGLEIWKVQPGGKITEEMKMEDHEETKMISGKWRAEGSPESKKIIKESALEGRK